MVDGLKDLGILSVKEKGNWMLLNLDNNYNMNPTRRNFTLYFTDKKYAFKYNKIRYKHGYNISIKQCN